MSAIDSQTWTRKGNVSATRRTYRSPSEALDQARIWQDAGRKVALSTEYFRDPASGKQFRLFTVTMRPRADWERFAEKEKGLGITGHEVSRAPTKEERKAAEAEKAAR